MQRRFDRRLRGALLLPLRSGQPPHPRLRQSAVDGRAEVFGIREEEEEEQEQQPGAKLEFQTKTQEEEEAESNK